MFKTDFKSQVSKHLGVFQKAVEGLARVRTEMSAERLRLHVRRQALLNEAADYEQEMSALDKHHADVGDTISKINVLLPGLKK